jgi:hypothetical protein
MGFGWGDRTGLAEPKVTHTETSNRTTPRQPAKDKGFRFQRMRLMVISTLAIPGKFSNAQFEGSFEGVHDEEFFC